jgi:hypothetical protein
MPNTAKSSKKAETTTTATANQIADVFTPVYLNSVSRVAELQKTSLDMVAEQTNEWINAWKKTFSFFPVSAPTFVFDMASQAVQTCVETQKNAIDLAVEQAEAVSEIANQRADAYSKITESATAAFKTTVTRSVEAQKKVLEFAAAQNKAAFAATRKQIGSGPAAVIVDSFERGAETVIEAQKSVLETAAKTFAAARA